MYKRIGFNPVVVYKGLLWSNIVYLFKANGINISGGSVSRRHKISPIEYRLSIFLYLSGLTSGTQTFKSTYEDKFFTNHKYDNRFYKHFKKLSSDGFYHTNSTMLDFLETNAKIRIFLLLKQIKSEFFHISSSFKQLSLKESELGNKYVGHLYCKKLAKINREKTDLEKQIRQLDIQFVSIKKFIHELNEDVVRKKEYLKQDNKYNRELAASNIKINNNRNDFIVK